MTYVYSAQAEEEGQYARGQTIDWDEFVAEYIDSRVYLKRSEKHCYDLANTLTHVADWYKKLGIPPAGVNRRNIKTHLHEYKASGKSDTSVHHRATKVLALYKWAYMEELYEKDKLATFQRPPIHDATARTRVTLEEIGKVIAEIHKTWSPECAPASRFRSKEAREFFDARDTAATLWMGETGSRVGETFSVELADVNIAERYALLRNTKNGDDRIAPLTQEYIDSWLGKWLAIRNNIETLSSQLFVSEIGLKLDPYTWGRQWDKYRQRAGIERRIRRHDLRHYSSSAHDKVSAEMSKLIIGHKTDQAHKIYSHREIADLVAAHDAASPMGPLLVSDAPVVVAKAKPKVRKVYTTAK